MTPKLRFGAQNHLFGGFGPQKLIFGPKTRPWRPLRETLQKHKGLGRFWEAQGRKTPKMEKSGQKSPQNKKIAEKAVLVLKMRKSAKSKKTLKCVTFFALKHKSKR